MENPVVFFFGAGAESKSFGLPNGAKYTRCTMCRKRTKLYEELRRFYKGRCSETYSGDYSGCFLFNKDSHTFREIIISAAEKCYNKGDANEEIKKFLIDKEEYDAAKRKKDKTAEIAARAKVDGFIGKMYDMIILDSDELEEDKKNYGKKTTYSLIEDNLSYYGAVEKDFSTIIFPKGAGKRRFWRLLNYFWSAYFTILEPLCRDFGWYQKDKKSEFYRYVLNNLESVTRQIYDGWPFVKFCVSGIRQSQGWR